MGSTILKQLSRPSSIILMGFLLLAMHGTMMKVNGNPLPADDSSSEKSLKDDLNTAQQHVTDFYERAKNTFTGKADGKEHKGLSPLELAGIIAAAVILLLILPCCIGYCLCECVKELICCIFCCSCCRD